MLAPMQGLTEVLMRRVYEACFPGAFDVAITPFVSLTHGPLNNPTKLADMMPEHNRGSMPIIPQILGKEPDEFVMVAQRLADWGYDEVNWNMGCPMRMVAAKHRGSGILPYPDEVRAILDAIVPRLPMRLSVKIRLGLHSPNEVFPIVRVLNDYPIASVIIHPRLGRQQYNGVPDMETFRQVLPLVQHPVVYNGDIVEPSKAARLQAEYPNLQGLMIGRGVFYRPTLPLEIKGNQIDAAQRLMMTKEFIHRLTQAIDEQIPTAESRMRKMKEYWCLLWRGLPISEERARQVLHAQYADAVEKLIFINTQ